jgi:proteasome lid subunit RPN8/RPN11
VIEAINLIIDDAIACAKRHAPKEMCGVVIIRQGKVAFKECRNIGKEDTSFTMHPQDYLEATRIGEVIAIVHSHGYHHVEPSDADLTACEMSAKPWLIVNTAGNSKLVLPSGYKAPLIGRTWAHGIHDCYALLKDSMQEMFGVQLLDYNRNVEWWINGENIIKENFQNTGFVRLLDSPLQHGDVVIMQVASKVPNHCAVWLQGNYILHHCFGRLSTRDVYGSSWQKLTVLHLRHQDLIK